MFAYYDERKKLQEQGEIDGEPFTVDNYILEVNAIGLNLADLEYMDIGMVFDVRKEWLWVRRDVDKDAPRTATQKDFDTF